MDYCRICTQHYTSRYIHRRKQLLIPYIAITSEINYQNLPKPDIISDYWLVKPLLPCYESPQKSSQCLVTLPNEDGWSLDQTIWSQHGQVWTLMGLL
jgi:hypothetical protein